MSAGTKPVCGSLVQHCMPGTVLVAGLLVCRGQKPQQWLSAPSHELPGAPLGVCWLQQLSPRGLQTACVLDEWFSSHSNLQRVRVCCRS